MVLKTDFLARACILKKNNVSAYAMLNLDCEHTKRMKQFKRWTRPWIFWSTDFNEFAEGWDD